MCFFARMSGILSSLNKSGQFMSDEKKKGGFWSWFGLGKNKQEASTEPKEPESKEQLPNESEVQETAEKTTALLDKTARENPSTEETLMAQASTLVPENHEVQVEISQEENPAAQAWTLAPSDESTQSIEETLENSTALSESEAEVQVESAVDIEDESVVEAEEHEEESVVADMVETQEKPSEGGFFSRLLKGLVKTKQNIGAGFRSFFLGKKIGGATITH